MDEGRTGSTMALLAASDVEFGDSLSHEQGKQATSLSRYAVTIGSALETLRRKSYIDAV